MERPTSRQRPVSRARDTQVSPHDVVAIITTFHRDEKDRQGVVAPETSNRDNVEQLVRSAGKLAIKENFRLFFTLLVPILLVSVWMFGLFAAISWYLPNVLCNELAQELSGSQLGLRSCVYVTSGDYFPWSGSRFFWLFFWSVQTAWVALFPGFVCRALFGSSMSRVQIIFTISVGAACFTATAVTGMVFKMALDNYFVVVFSAAGSLAVNIVCSSAAVRYTGDRLMRWRWILLFSFAGQVNNVYLFIMPKLITARAEDTLGGQGLLIVRILVHPFIWTVVLTFFRTVQRHIGRVPNLQQTCFIVWPMLYASLYGRFLLLQLEGMGSVIVINFMFACFSISGSLDQRGQDEWWLKLIYGERAKDAMMATRDVDESALVNYLTTSMTEAASILAASALLSLGGITPVPGLSPDHLTIWYNAAVQMVTELSFQFIQIVATGKYHNIEWRKALPKSNLRFLAYVIFVVTLGGSRLCVELLLLFCPKVYGNDKILLEQCDKDSLFNAIDLKSYFL